MLTFSTGTKIKGSLRQQIGNALEISKLLKKVKSDHRKAAKKKRTPETHGKSSCILLHVMDDFEAPW